MRNRTARSLAPLALLGGAPLLALLFATDTARAQQIDTNPPLPNVMLLIDNSGSMERMIDGNTPEDDANPLTPSGTNKCNCTGNGPDRTPTCNFTATPPSPNRWNTLQQAFTGTLAGGFSCVGMPRTGGTVFANEYDIDGKQPYDANYYIHFHRMVAPDAYATGASTATPGACVVAPGGLNGAANGSGVGETGSGLGGNATDFTGSCSGGQCSGSIVTREYGLLRTPVSCTFAQNNDGAIPQMRDLMRFGVMMFDSDPDASIGVTTGSAPQVLPNAAFTGMWTYYPGWDSGAACLEAGNPAGCATTSTLAVGARNSGAPAWEGRMVGFPTTNDITAQEKNNGIIDEVVLAARPYGGTPTAGMFAGAKYFFLTDPKGPGQSDAYVRGGCRNQYVILLTDGAPNLDMQSACSAAGSPAGVCPYPLPQQTAAQLWNNGNNAPGSPSIETFVIGFAVSSFQDQGVTANCSQLAQNGNLSSQCNCAKPFNQTPQPPDSAAIEACCSVQCIAEAGGSGNAYFADTQSALQNALGTILGQIAKNATTRTTPTYSPVIANVIAGQGNSNSNVFLSAFTPKPNQPWSGTVQRQRYVCQTSGNTFVVQPPTITPGSGDDFEKNLDSNSGPARTFIAFEPAAIASAGGVGDSTTTIRPYATASVGDGLGQYSATTHAGTAAAVIPSITPDALNIPAAGCAYLSTQTGQQKYLSQQQCTTMLLDYDFAQPSFGGGPPDFSFASRSGNAFGDIFHANPVVVGPPGSLLQDPVYVAFRQQWAASTSTRAVPTTCPSGQSTCRNTVVYAATNDGLLHAFWADETSLENNEMWAMLLPQPAASLLSSYPSSHEFLLDGSLVAKDVVWDRSSTTSASNVWHTMLVAGYGSSFPGYYAVDVTNPDPTGMTNGSVPTDPPPVGPVFRWQLTKMPATNFQLFGQSSATPAITTLFMDPGDGLGTREIGVAILPGGQDGPATSTLASGGCARTAKPNGDSAPINSYTARGTVRCWGATKSTSDPVVGRSLTIVRLDTGEIIRTFARIDDFAKFPNDTLVRANRVIDARLDSPMTGTPVVYPTDVGTDTTKAFVGDADGTIWKFDLSNSDPSKWTGELYLDLYNATAYTNTVTAWNDGQPLQVTPVVSLDPAGEVVLDVATGTTQVFDTNGSYFVYSITEKVQGNPAKLRANVNWWLGPATMSPAGIGFDPGERVSGPMTVFNGTLYFSTYAAAAQVQACSNGTAKLWGRDFVRPDVPSDLTQGGVREMQPPPPAPPPMTLPISVDPGTHGAVVPGVTIMNTPACASLGNPAADQYVFGQSHSAPQNFTAGSFSLFSQVGKTGGTGGSAAGTMQINLQTPIAPTAVDSWAAVLE
jgi:type IV pilus assembly protein PilY1